MHGALCTSNLSDWEANTGGLWVTAESVIPGSMRDSQNKVDRDQGRPQASTSGFQRHTGTYTCIHHTRMSRDIDPKTLHRGWRLGSVIRALTVLPEDLGLILSTHTVAHIYL